MKRILIVGVEPFLPVISGSRKVVYEYCKLLKSQGHDLFFCNWGNIKFSQEFIDFFDNKVFALDYTSTRTVWINKIRKHLITYHYHKTGFNYVDEFIPLDLPEYVSKLNEKFHFDICIVNYISLSKVLVGLDVERKVIFTHDAFTYKYEILHLDQGLNLEPNEEAKAIRRATDILAIQDNEAHLFHYYNPKARIYTVYSPFEITRQDRTDNNNLLLLSSNNRINRNGVDYFLKEVFPIVLKSCKDAKLVVGGGICDYIREKYELDNIELVGLVDDPAVFFSKGDIAINPVYQGTGLKIKTMESLSYGKITIVHPHSVEGIFQSYNSPLLVGHTKEEMADHIINVLNDKKGRIAIINRSIDYIMRMNEKVLAEYRRLTTF